MSLTAAPGDWDLLDLFLARKDEPAFAEIVRRHGPKVLNACRRVLRDADRAEDAFQATSMMIAKAKAVSVIAAVGIAVGGGGGALAYHTLKAQEPKATAVETFRGGSKDELNARTFEGVFRAVKPRSDEWPWLKIPWITDLWAARQKASEEDKPILYFSTGGAGFNDPLGVC